LGGAEADALLAPLKTKWDLRRPVRSASRLSAGSPRPTRRARPPNSRAVAEANAAGRRRAPLADPYWHVID
jgi:hypothetical protein